MVEEADGGAAAEGLVHQAEGGEAPFGLLVVDLAFARCEAVIAVLWCFDVVYDLSCMLVDREVGVRIE